MKDVDRRDAEGLAANLHSCVSPALNHIILLLAALLQNSASSAAACNLRKSSTANPPQVGGLAERPLSGAVVGPTFGCLLGQQFQILKKGDRWNIFFAPSLFKHFLTDSGTRITFLRQLLQKVHKQ